MDLVVSSDQGSGGRIFFELKVDDIGDSIWDLGKLASLISGRPDDTAVVAVAATGAAWNRDFARAGVFEPPMSETLDETWDMRFLMAAYAESFRKALTYSARPAFLPSKVCTELLGVWPVTAYPGYELRSCAVRAFDTKLALSDGWPLPDPRTIRDEDLTLSDVPHPDAGMHEIKRFAVTTNGYANYGSVERLERFTVSAYERWKETGALPDTLTELRSFLFFHQRADHFGSSFDEGYARAVVSKIRDLV